MQPLISRDMNDHSFRRTRQKQLTVFISLYLLQDFIAALRPWEFSAMGLKQNYNRCD